MFEQLDNPCRNTGTSEQRIVLDNSYFFSIFKNFLFLSEVSIPNNSIQAYGLRFDLYARFFFICIALNMLFILRDTCTNWSDTLFRSVFWASPD